jgi:LmbE family N-acetylglucosaminyl deacetylase
VALNQAISRERDVMRALQLAAPGERLAVLCLGAHSDDIEIGAGATLLSMMDRGIRLDVHWCVLSGAGEREQEAKSSAADFLSSAASAKIEVVSFRDVFFPSKEMPLSPGSKR